MKSPSTAQANFKNLQLAKLTTFTRFTKFTLLY